MNRILIIVVACAALTTFAGCASDGPIPPTGEEARDNEIDFSDGERLDNVAPFGCAADQRYQQIYSPARFGQAQVGTAAPSGPLFIEAIPPYLAFPFSEGVWISHPLLGYEALFTLPISYPAGPPNDFFGVSRDGQRFLFARPYQGDDEEALAPQFVLVQNWIEELKARVPVP